MSAVPFVRLFLPFVPAPARERLRTAEAALEALLQARWRAAVDAWPGVALMPAEFWAYVGARVPVTVEAADAIAALRLDELYLACACAAGHAGALAFVEARYLPAVGGALARMRLDAATVDEVKQRLRRRLFTREGAREPKIGGYSGRGDLGAWLRATGVRVALRLLRDEHGQPRAGDAHVPRSAGDADAELRYLKLHYRPLFRAAFAEAVGDLVADERALIREYYGDGRTIAEIAARRAAHRVTVSRWLDEIRHRLLERTRRGLMRRVRVSQGECDSILRLVQSQFDLTFHRLLGGAGP
ncbi:MAG TPA: transcriptional regulator [Polyangia bacterium]|nr:transcriptional regulator [Polyangia bacterium]